MSFWNGWRRDLCICILSFFVLVAGLVASKFLFHTLTTPVRSGVHGVFLSNGQVYFGTIEKENRTRIVLKNIFYLQTPKDGATTGAQDVQLLKLGNELHGPEDFMEINTTQVLFIEKLKEDGKVAKAIHDYKK